MKALAILVGMVAMLAQTSPEASLDGDWINEDLKNPTILRLTIQPLGKDFVVHVWVKCEKGECDGGENVTRGVGETRLLVWKRDGDAVNQLLHLESRGRLQVETPGENRTESFVHQSAEGDKARALLAKVAQKYRTMTGGFFESDTKEAGGERLVKTYIGAGGKFRAESKGRNKNILRVSDGKNIWRVDQDSHHYTSFEFIPHDPGNTQVSRYEYLDDISGNAKIVREETCASGQCAVVSITLPEYTELDGDTEILWVDTATFQVWKDVVGIEGDRSPGALRDTKVTVTFTAERWNEAQPETLFAYKPPASMEAEHAAPTAPKLLGKEAPDFTLKDLDGKKVKLKDLRGKTVLLDFWASSSTSCRSSMPDIDKLHRDYAAKGLAVFGVNIESAKAARDFLNDKDFALTTLIDGNRDVYHKYELRGLPTLVLIDKAGKIVYYQFGFAPRGLEIALRAQGIV